MNLKIAGVFAIIAIVYKLYRYVLDLRDKLVQTKNTQKVDSDLKRVQEDEKQVSKAQSGYDDAVKRFNDDFGK